MKKILLYIFLFLVVSANVFALQVNEINAQIKEAQIDLEEFFNDVERQDLIIITGSKISFEDKLIFNLIKSNHEDLQGIEVKSDSYALTDAEVSGKTIIMIGSDKTNLMSKKLSEEGKIEENNVTNYSPLILDYALQENGEKALFIYSEKEANNNQNSAAEKSPLSRLMDKKYVPAVATLLSVLLLYLWNLFGKTLGNIFSDFISSKFLDKVTKNKDIKKEKKHHMKPHEFINRFEVIAFLLTVIIFSLTMSWTWSDNLKDMLSMFLIIVVVVGVISFIREFVRLVYCYRQKINSEYTFWPLGTVITLLSTFLGNTFSLASYTLLDKEADEKKFGKVSFLIAVFTLIIGILAYILNILWPSLAMQMAFVYSIMVLFIELFPMQPMPGSDIIKWNKFAWIVIYVLVTVSYLYVNFTAYV